MNLDQVSSELQDPHRILVRIILKRPRNDDRIDMLQLSITRVLSFVQDIVGFRLQFQVRGQERFKEVMNDVLIFPVFLYGFLFERVAFEKGQREFARGRSGRSGCHGVEVDIRGACLGGYIRVSEVGLRSVQVSE